MTIAEGDRRVTSTGRGLLQDREIDEIERSWPDGLTSRQIVDVFETRGIRFSEATLRKYVQLVCCRARCASGARASTADRAGSIRRTSCAG